MKYENVVHDLLYPVLPRFCFGSLCCSLCIACGPL